jgi:hypothetical protein
MHENTKYVHVAAYHFFGEILQTKLSHRGTGAHFKPL